MRRYWLGPPLMAGAVVCLLAVTRPGSFAACALTGLVVGGAYLLGLLIGATDDFI